MIGSDHLPLIVDLAIPENNARPEAEDKTARRSVRDVRTSLGRIPFSLTN